MEAEQSVTGTMSAKPAHVVFNLINEPWLPLRRRSGAVEHIPPWRINDRISEDPFVSFAWPRPDFNGAAHEFLVGLLSTAAAPADDDEWKDWWLDPPPPDVLEPCFSTVAHAFDLDGSGPRFLQDLDPFEDNDDAGRRMGVSALLIDAPGQQTLDNNADLFVKRDAATTLCRAVAAMALYTLSTYAPRGIATGGRGHRQSLRKAGPLTTLIIANHKDYGDTLWGRLWPNVETKEQIGERSVDAFSHDDFKLIFPWLTDTRTSADGRETTPSDVHPLHVYWGMPRRIRLVFEIARSERCALTGALDAQTVKVFHIKPYGTNYSDGFEHPLTPHRRKNASDPKLLPVSPEHSGIGYRHWPVIQWGDTLNNPARVIRHWVERAPEKDSPIRLLAYGYFGAVRTEWKARAWVESEMPLWILNDTTSRDWLEGYVNQAVKGAETVTKLLAGAVKKVLYDPSSGNKPSRQRRQVVQAALDGIARRFYRETESAFYGTLGEAVSAIKKNPDSDDPTIEARRRWAPIMEKVALHLFDEHAPSEGLENRDMHRHVKARFLLTLALCGHGTAGKSLFDGDLGIASPETRQARKGPEEVA